jgi:GNAT superfamily N-acetyltransferase
MVWLNNLGFADPYGTTTSAVDALFTRGARDLGNGLLVVRVGDDRLLPAVIDCLAKGECGTTSTAPDPLLDWVYEPRASEEVYNPLAAPPTSHRLKWFNWLMSYSAYFALARNGLYALVDSASPGRVLAAAVTGPPGTIPYGRMSGGEMGDWCQKAGMEMAIAVLANGPPAMRNRTLGTWQAQAHGDGTHKHLEVVIIATAPECQGRGVGTALLTFLGEVADADGVPTHLETAGSRNAAFYATKGGYHVVHRSPVASFDSGLAMQRPSAGHGGGGGGPRAPTAAAAEMLQAGGGSSGCRGFQPKRASGPLASYCSSCGEHMEKCTAKAVR